MDRRNTQVLHGNRMIPPGTGVAMKPKPVSFKSSDAAIARRRCMICKDPDSSEWVSESLRLTRESGEPRPSALFIHKELRSAFPDVSPAHETTTRRHLNDHDLVWRSWLEEG